MADAGVAKPAYEYPHLWQNPRTPNVAVKKREVSEYELHCQALFPSQYCEKGVLGAACPSSFGQDYVISRTVAVPPVGPVQARVAMRRREDDGSS
jgi:hypothetical protein